MFQAIALFQLGVFLLPSAGAQFPMGPPVPLAGPPPLAPPPLPMPMPLHLPVPVRQQQVPVVVMPYRSKSSDRIFKKKKRRKPLYYSSSSTSSDTSRRNSYYSSSAEYEFRSRKRRPRRKKKREVLTPVISYLTRNGRVVYRKKIKKENPSDWLTIGTQRNSLGSNSGQKRDPGSGEMTVRDLKKKYNLKKHKRKHH